MPGDSALWSPVHPLAAPESRVMAMTLADGDYSQRHRAPALSRLLQAASAPASVHWLQQVHGTRVFDVDAGAAEPDGAGEWPEADAQWTAEPSRGLAILTADCLPVVLAAVDGTCIGVAHAGWRGLFQGVVPELIAAMPVAPRHLHAWCGPSISARHFEVGPEVIAALDGLGLPDAVRSRLVVPYGSSAEPTSHAVDLQGLLRWQLRDCASVQTSGVCTVTESRCDSYRRDGTASRMLTLAWLQ